MQKTSSITSKQVLSHTWKKAQGAQKQCYQAYKIAEILP